MHKSIFFFSVPLILTNVFQVLFNIVDIAVAGQFAGTSAMGAIGCTSMTLYFFTGLLMGLSGAVNALVSYFVGSRNMEKQKETVYTSFVVCLGIGVILSIAGIVLSRPVLTAMKTKPELLDGAVLYFRIFALGLIPLALYNYGAAVLNSYGDTKRPLMAMTLAGSANVVFDVVFVVIFNWGVAGIAIASVLCVSISCALVLFFIFKKLPELGARFSQIYFNIHNAVRIIKLGLPAGLQFSTFAIANSFIQMGVNNFSSVVVAGCAAEDKLDALVYNTMAAFYVACATFIARNYGAKNKAGIRKAYRICLGYSFATGALLGLLLQIFGRQLLAIFTPDTAAIDAGMQKLTIMSFSFCVSAFMDGSVAAARGMGKTLVPSLIIIMGSCVFRLIWIFTIFAYFKTIESLFLIYIFSWMITGAWATFYFFKIYKAVPDC